MHAANLIVKGEMLKKTPLLTGYVNTLRCKKTRAKCKHIV